MYSFVYYIDKRYKVSGVGDIIGETCIEKKSQLSRGKRERGRERHIHIEKGREREREREISICKNKEYKKAKSFIWMF